MKYVLISILFTVHVFSYAQNNWEKAYSTLFSIDTTNNEVRYLHFKIRTQPEFHYFSKPYLTDVYYSIDYKEFGTPESFTWVELFDGHLINDLEKKYSSQWQGPFAGNRGISYEFFFELMPGDSNDNSQKLNITIFSTDPELDFKYCNVDPHFPFQVKAIYYDTKNLETAMDIYSGASIIHTVYTMGKSSNVAVTIGTELLEEIITYAIQYYLTNLPIYLTLKCNVCGHTETIVIKDLNYNEIYTCKTNGCYNSAKIILIN